MTVATKRWQVAQDIESSLLGEVFNSIENVWPGGERSSKAMAEHEMEGLLRYLRMRPLAAQALQPILVGPRRAANDLHSI